MTLTNHDIREALNLDPVREEGWTRVGTGITINTDGVYLLQWSHAGAVQNEMRFLRAGEIVSRRSGASSLVVTYLRDR